LAGAPPVTGTGDALALSEAGVLIRSTVSAPSSGTGCRTDGVDDRRRAFGQVDIDRPENRVALAGQDDVRVHSARVDISLGLVRVGEARENRLAASTNVYLGRRRGVSHDQAGLACGRLRDVIHERCDLRFPVRVEVGHDADVGAAGDLGVVSFQDRLVDRLTGLGESEVVGTLWKVEGSGDCPGFEVVERLLTVDVHVNRLSRDAMNDGNLRVRREGRCRRQSHECAQRQRGRGRAGDDATYEQGAHNLLRRSPLDR
jgi:hypothetical protein